MFTRFVALAALCGSVLSFTGCCCGPTACGTCGPQMGCSPLADVLPVRLASRAASRVVNPCADGCGEVYWGERINHPPVLDPCGCEQSCRPVLSRLGDLWGRPYAGACECANTGCDACGGGSMYVDEGVTYATSAPMAKPHCASCMAAQQSQTPVPMASSPAPQVRTSSQGRPTPAVRPAEPVSSQSAMPASRDLQVGTPAVRHVRPASTSRTITR